MAFVEQDTSGIVIIKGDVPKGSVALVVATELAAERNHIVVVKALDYAKEPSVQREGLPITIIVDPVQRSDN